MNKNAVFCAIIFVSFAAFFAYADETLSIVTYYPSPLGSYNELTVMNRMSIGDTNADGNSTSADLALDFNGAPLAGSLMVKQSLGIGPLTPTIRSVLLGNNVRYTAALDIAQGPARGNGIVTIGTEAFNTPAIIINKGNGTMSCPRTNGCASDIVFDTNGGIAADRGIFFFVDQDNNEPDATSNAKFRFRSNGDTTTDTSTSEIMVIGEDGRVGIGVSNPGYTLHVVGDAAKTTGASWTAISDGRYKNIVGPISSPLSLIGQLKPLRYTWNGLLKSRFGPDAGIKYGFVAQDLQSVIPEFVTQDAQGYLWSNTSGLEAIITAALQELKNSTEKEIDDLKSSNKRLQKRIEALERALAKRSTP